LKYSTDSCLGLLEWGRRFDLELRRAQEEDRPPRLHWTVDYSGNNHVQRSLLLMPDCLVSLGLLGGTGCRFVA
jgi:hypothetical protein